MTLTSAPIQERRKFSRSDSPPRLAINLLQPHGAIAASSVNFSEGGLCLRLQEMLEVRSLVRLQFTPGAAGAIRAGHPVEFTGRVAWIIQRLDLRDRPPFLFDIGIEFVDPPPMLRKLMVQSGARLTAALKAQALRTKTLDSSMIRGRCFIPRLERESSQPPRWHLVVSIDGVPCFSARYPSERAAMMAWIQFKRRQAKR